MSFYSELTPNKKLLFLIAILIFILIVIRLVVWIVKTFNTKGQRQELQDITTQISALQNQGVRPSYPSAQYSTWANQLRGAFAGCGTSNEVWRNVFSKMKNDLDVALLIDTYGVRTFDECNWEADFGDFTGSLSEALVNELSPDELAEVNKLLESNKVNYRF